MKEKKKREIVYSSKSKIKQEEIKIKQESFNPLMTFNPQELINSLNKLDA